MNPVRKYIGLATIIVALSASLAVTTASAAVNTSLTYSTCALSIHPFKVGGTSVNDLASQWFNVFTGSGTCTAHLQYPNQYSPQPPTAADNPFKSVTNVESIYAPTTRHIHTYHNASLEDKDSTPADNFYYKAYMAKFQVTLENDALLKTDQAQIICGTATGTGTYIETPGCNGTVSAWGTTKISYNSSTGVITWDFAEGADKTGRPMLWGENSTLGKSHGYFGTYVKLVSKNNPEEVWSATTTSRALIRDLALLKSSDTSGVGDMPSCTNDGVAGATKDFDGNWCTTNPPSLSGVEGTEINDSKTYYWYRIGVVGTVWKKPPTPPKANCTALTLTPKSITAPGKTDYIARVTFDDGKSYDTTVAWTQTNGTLSRTSQTQTSSANFTNTYNTTATSGSVTAKVSAVTGANNSTTCQTGVTVTKTPPKAVCKAITLTPNSITPQGKTDYIARVTFDDGKAYDTTVSWTQTNGTLSRTSQTQTSSANYTNTYSTSATSGSVTAKVASITGADNSTTCQTGITVTLTPPPPPKATCQKITLTPNSVTAPGATKYTATVTFNDGKSYNTQVAWGQTNGTLSEATNQSHGSSTPYTNTYTTTKDSGTVSAKVVLVTGADNSATCQTGITITKTPPPPPKATCQKITLTPNSVTAPGSTKYTATVTFDDGKSYNTQVQWEQTNGSLSDAMYQSHGSSTPYTNTYTTTKDSGSVTVKVATVLSGANNSPTCQTGVTVTKTPPPPKATCQKITLTPNSVTAPGSTKYTATVTFDDGKSYNTQVQWGQTNGSLSDAMYQSHASSTPYTNTYTTIQNSGSVTAKVATVLSGANNSPTCQTGITVTKTPPTTPTCQRIELTPNSITAPGTTPFTAKVVFSDGKAYTTTVGWTQTNGTLSSAATQTHFSSSDFTNTYTTIQNSGSVRARVLAISGGAENSMTCQTGITITKTPPPPPGVCQNVTMISSRPLPLSENQSTIFRAAGSNTDGSSVDMMKWTTTAGTLTGYSSTYPELCGKYGSTLTLPPVCQVIFNGGPEGTVIRVSSVPPAGAECEQSTTVIKKTVEKPYCEYLTLNPTTLNSSTTLRAHAYFSDGNTYNTTIGWSGSNGRYSDSTTKTQSSANNFINTFNVTNKDRNATASVRVTAIPGGEADIGSCGDTISKKYTPPNPVCEDLNLTFRNGDVCATINPSDFEGTIKWTIGDNSSFTRTIDDKNCISNVSEDTYVRAYVNANCNDVNSPSTPPGPPKIHKNVRLTSTTSSTNYVSVLTLPPTADTKTLEYQVVFDPQDSQGISAYIVDDISKGKIDGELRPESNKYNPGHIEYIAGSMKVTQVGHDLQECAPEEIDYETGEVIKEAIDENCWEKGGDIGRNGVSLVKITGGPVTITYRGTIESSAITPTACQDGKICEEKYTNTAHASVTYDSGASYNLPTDIKSNPVLVQIFCQYILTRAAGDIYMESDLYGGIDISQCSKYTSTTGLIIVPDVEKPGTVVSTGSGDTKIAAVSHEICTEGQANSLDTSLTGYYGSEVSGNLSSQICEVKLQAGTAWQQTAITNDIDENKNRISRWEPDFDMTGMAHGEINLSSLIIQSGIKNVYHIKNADLIIDSEYTLNDGEGAKTFIIEDGSLKIMKDIKYGPCNKTICNVNDIASLAFVVLNGNASIDKSVQEISGVYFIQGECESGTQCTKGQIFSVNNEESLKQLKVYGSIYGDIQPLFTSRLFSGDPAKQDSGILIRFDERIILNTPPGLRDVLSLSQTEVAR